ncbi:MAG: ribosome maturation factor RimM [Bacteriovoracaceae bacterium]|jgi:16S rRNA processing protein RimM|nr:ribosome maturation factor RimM [Bacteriovoracaceae bacterium]
MGFIHLGSCNKVHGIKGELTFSLINNEDSCLKDGMSFFTSEAVEASTFKIEKIKFGNKVIVKLAGVDNRNTAESIIPFEIYVNKKDLKKEDDEYFLSDLVGFEVINEASKRVGIVEGFYTHGAGDIIVIKLKNDDNLELPFNKTFFPSIDFHINKIVMINPEII